MHDSQRNLTLHEFFESVYLPIKNPLASPGTSHQFGYAFSKLAALLKKTPTLSDLSDENLARLVRTMRADGIAVTTINRGPLARLLAIWRFAAQRGYLPIWPAISPLKEPEIIPESWGVEEIKKLLAGCNKMPGFVGNHFAPLWWRAFNLTCLYTGERTGALLSVPYNNYNPQNRTLAVPADCRKGRQKPALYRELPDVLVEALNNILQPERPKLFCWPNCTARFYAAYTHLLKLSGLPSGRRHKPQKIRRTFASWLEQAGGDATKALQHSDRRVTIKSYLDPRLDNSPAPASLLPDVSNP